VDDDPHALSSFLRVKKMAVNSPSFKMYRVEIALHGLSIATQSHLTQTPSAPLLLMVMYPFLAQFSSAPSQHWFSNSRAESFPLPPSQSLPTNSHAWHYNHVSVEDIFHGMLSIKHPSRSSESTSNHLYAHNYRAA
jgi:hypothetical protein